MNCQREIDLLELLSWWVLPWEGVIRRWGLCRSLTACGYGAWFFLFFLPLFLSGPGAQQWQHQMFLGWQVRGREAAREWRPLSQSEWGAEQSGANFQSELMGQSDTEGQGWCGIMCVRMCVKKQTLPKQTTSFSITHTVSSASLWFIYKMNFSLLHTKKFLLHMISGFFYQDNLINRLSSELISCGNEARGTGVSTPEDFAIPADSRARLIISQ